MESLPIHHIPTICLYVGFFDLPFHLDLASVCPRYLMPVEFGITFSLMCKLGGTVDLLFVKFTLIDLS